MVRYIQGNNEIRIRNLYKKKADVHRTELTNVPVEPRPHLDDPTLLRERCLQLTLAVSAVPEATCDLKS